MRSKIASVSGGSAGVYESMMHQPTAGSEDARHLADGGADVVEVMRRDAARHDVERAVLQGQRGCVGGDERDVGRAALPRQGLGLLQHRLGDVAGHDVADPGRQRQGGVPRAAADVEGALGAGQLGRLDQRGEVRPLGVIPARRVRRRRRPKLPPRRLAAVACRAHCGNSIGALRTSCAEECTTGGRLRWPVVVVRGPLISIFSRGEKR